MKLSIIFVLYNSNEVIETALDAVYASRVNFDYEVIIVDNASPDNSVEIIKSKYLSKPEFASKTKLILNGRNDGFGAGNNVGMKQASGDYILLLNTDTKLEPDNLQIMVDFMQVRTDVGAATCKLVMANGEIDKASRRAEPDLVRSFFRLFGLQALFPKLFGGYNLLHQDPNKESAIDACSGAYLLMSRAAYQATGGFDERYFMYAEDLDLCRQIREAGFKVWWYPKTSCVHYRGQSSKKTAQKTLKAFYQANWLYYKKWYSKKYFYLLDPFVFVANWSLYLVRSIHNAMLPVEKRYVSK
ncbi:MAG TPA: glycosyltransferase family 2 protein [Candidatus Doudnabacteria bacterium]|mgnify:CR=1 FL=1|nr:glycosyltransferase family 2 protein [Candidatus Doudnabacteria bacterium]